VSDEILEIFRDGRQHATAAGSKYIDASHITKEQLDVLAEDALTFLRSRVGKPSEMSGWTRISAAQAGLLPYWSRLAGWATEDEKKTFRPLRKNVYDLLDQRGLIVKPPGQGASLDISPAAVVAPDIADRVLNLVERIGNETGIVAADYRQVAVAASPNEALRLVVGSSTTTKTTSGLSSVGRLDLSLEQAVLDWKDLAIDPTVLTTARERLEYWKST
jgi:hypothetical protein